MANYSTFFPKSSGTGGGSSPGPGNKTNRRILYGPLSGCVWPVPEGTTEVEVHVWGGGGGHNGVNCDSGGGGGGGYARARYSVTSSDSLTITVGGEGGTSSVTIPTQSPISPVSATGGSNAPPTGTCPTGQRTGGLGGSGSISLGPQHPTAYSYSTPGMRGGSGDSNIFPSPTSPIYAMCIAISGAGGAAGSPRRVYSPQPCGGWPNTAYAETPNFTTAQGGGGIGFPSDSSNGGGTNNTTINCIGAGKNYNRGVSYSIPACPGLPCGFDNVELKRAYCKDDVWFYVEDIKGEGSRGFCSCDQIHNNYNVGPGGTGAGGGGGGMYRYNIVGPAARLNSNIVQGGRGGMLGGGGGNVYYCIDAPCTYTWSPTDGKGGAAGGSSGNPGTPGIVILYW